MLDKNKKIGFAIIAPGLLFAAVLTVYLIFSFETEPAGIVSEQRGAVELPEPVIVSEDFDEAVAQLDTSQKLVNYLNSDFIFEPKEGNIALTPQEFFEKKKGGEQDFAAFAAYVLHKNKFTSYIFIYHYINEGGKEKSRFLTVFRDTDLPKYIYFDEKGVHIIHYGWSFEELCQKEEGRNNIKITKYGVIPPLTTELILREWRERK